MRWSPVVGRFDLYSAEVLGNPLLRTRRLEELLESRPVKVKPVWDWECAGQPYEVQERGEAERRHREVEAERLGRPVSLMGGLDYGLLREARKPQEKSGRQQDPSLGVELPRDFDEFLALVEAAFGEGSEGRDSGFGIRRSGPGTGDLEFSAEGRDTGPCNPQMDPRLRGGDEPGIWNPLSSDVIPAKAGIHESSPAFETQVASPELRTPNTESRNSAPTLRDLAQLLWDSATLHRRRGEEEARLLAEYLTEYAARLASRDPQDARRRQGVANNILKLFRQGIKQQEESVVVTRRARLALHDIAVERFGRRPEWEEQLVYRDDRFEQGSIEFFDLYFAEFNRQ
ncbi:MAG TPA: hypothetical protein VMT20_22550, partial [Terriglobia bacterium]|nr:hypothetical protein [Terriglobia bacterium]